MGTLLGEGTLPFSYFPAFNFWKSTHKGKNLLLEEQILSFKSRLLTKWFHHPVRQTGVHENCSPSQKWLKDMLVYPHTLVKASASEESTTLKASWLECKRSAFPYSAYTHKQKY